MTFKNNNNELEQLMKKLIKKGFLPFTLANLSNIERFSFMTEKGNRVELLDNGVLLFEPLACDETLDIVLSCGVHGNETGPIEMITSIVDEAIHDRVAINYRVLFIIGNPEAAINGTRFVEENLNRLFGPAHDFNQTLEGARAIKLRQYIDEFYQKERKRIHYDFHTAIRGSLYPQFVIYPHQDDGVFDAQHLSFFKSSHIDTILLSHQPSSTFSYFSSHYYHANAFTIELGSVKPFGQNDHTQFYRVKESLLSLLQYGDTVFDNGYTDADYRIFNVKHELLKQSEEFQLHVGKTIENFQTFPIGYQLTSDIDGGYIINDPKEAIVFPNENVPIGQRAGLIVSELTT